MGNVFESLGKESPRQLLGLFCVKTKGLGSGHAEHREESLLRSEKLLGKKERMA